MVKRALVIGDVHGMIYHLEQLLTHWLPQSEQLILVGDYIDRGENSRQSLLLVHELTLLKGAIALRGNHEAMFIDYLKKPKRYWRQYYLNGGNFTVGDLLNISPQDISANDGVTYQRAILKNYPWLLPWLERLPYYTEFGNFIIVHAGLDLTLPDWRDTAKDTFIWTREEFLNQPNKTKKHIIFGHTPTIMMQPEGGLYQSNDGKYGIDGGAVYGLELIGVKISKDTIKEVIHIPVQKE